MITPRLFLLILAFLFFLLGASNYSHPRFNPVAAGLALWVLSLLLWTA